MAEYAGLLLGITRSGFAGEDDHVDSTSTAGDVGLLLRRFDTGLIEARYSRSEIVVQLSTGDRDVGGDTYTLSGAYYLNRIDLLVSRSRHETDLGGLHNAFYMGGAYYPSDNVRIGASVGGLDQEGNYILNVSYQPQILGNRVSVSFGYQDAEDYQGYSLSLTHYFDARVPLIERIRRY